MKIDNFRSLMDQYGDITAESHKRSFEYLLEIGIDPSNFYQELEMSSRFVNTHRDISYSSVPVNLHSHSYYEILYCHKPAGVEYLIGPNRYRLQRGDILFVPPEVSHRPIMPDHLSEPYERDVLWLSQEFVSTLVDLFPDHTVYAKDFLVPIRTARTKWDFFGELFRAGVIEEEQKRPGWEIAVLGNTLMILSNMKRCFIERSVGTMKAEKPEMADRIAAYIDTNYATQIRIDDLARRFYVSNSTISHQFKQKMGISIYSYITQRRLIAAKERIAQNIPLEIIADQVGFSDYSTFYRAFKQEFGISPKQYRQYLL